MTVKELIGKLQALGMPDAEVLFADPAVVDEAWAIGKVEPDSDVESADIVVLYGEEEAEGEIS